VYQSHTGRLTGLWVLPKPAQRLNTNDDHVLAHTRHTTFNENSPSGSPSVLCGLTDSRDEANSRPSHICKGARPALHNRSNSKAQWPTHTTNSKSLQWRLTAIGLFVCRCSGRQLSCLGTPEITVKKGTSNSRHLLCPHSFPTVEIVMFYLMFCWPAS
jgi:hypothetical protein